MCYGFTPLYVRFTPLYVRLARFYMFAWRFALPLYISLARFPVFLKVVFVHCIYVTGLKLFNGLIKCLYVC